MKRRLISFMESARCNSSSKVKYLKILIVLLYVLHGTSSFAQPYYFRRYQVENGLSHNSVYCTLQDNNGFLWFGTRDGLNRFDGRTFKVFQHDPEDPFTLKNNFILSLCQDETGIMWVGTYRGLYKYNPTKENFSIVKKTDTYSVESIIADNNNNIWFIEGRTLSVYQRKTDSIIHYAPQRYFNASTICKTKDNVIWIGSTDGRLQKYNSATNSFTQYEVFNESSLAFSHEIESLYPTADNKLLAGSLQDGVRMFDIATGTSAAIAHHNRVIPARCFLEKETGEYWIGSESGIYIYHSDTKKINHLEKNYNNPYALSDNAIYCLTLDIEGAVWIGSYFGGVNYYPNQKMVFEKFFPDYTTQTISGNAVTEICQDKYDNLWIATEDAGINRLERKTNTFTHFKPNNVNTGLSYFNFHCILLTEDTLWAGTWGHGIDLLNIKTGKVFHRYKAGPGEGDLKNNKILRLCRSGNSDIYVGTENGLFCYSQKTKSFKRIAEIPRYEPIYAIHEDKKGTVWVGSRGQSIYYFNKTSKQTGAINTGISNSNGEDVGLNQVTGILEDSNGLLWFATEGSGLINYHPSENKIGKRFTTKNGLPSNTIFKILEDEQKNLWISTSKGLVRLNPLNDSIKIFTKANGLLTDQFNYNSGYRSHDGSMYFGSVKGLISFKPADFSPNLNQSPIYITGIQVNNKELAITEKKSPLKESILSTKKLVLKYQQSSFSIDFASLSFLAPEMLEYKYIMSGVDENWIYLKSNRRVYYTELPPGSYTFKITGANSSGIWSDQETTLAIEILPPWWASKMAYAIYAILFVAMSLLIIRFYNERAKEKNAIKMAELEHEKEKQIYEAKIDFFTNVAHEIRTPLTLIKAPLEKIIKKAGIAHPFGNNLKIMESNTERLIELTSQFLDFRKTETSSFLMDFNNANISSLLLERFASFKTIAEEKNIQFSLGMPDQEVFAVVDVDAMHKILNNLFTNALNYSEKNVFVRLSVLAEQDRFMIEFSNDGNLIPDNMKEMIFEPFFRIKETSQITGTGIGLALSRSLAEMHKGEIYLKERGNDMNNFVLIIPMNYNIANEF